MTNPPNYPRYLTLAKNIRGLAVYDPTDPPERELFTWLSRKHQYRNVGLPPGLVDHPTVDLTDYKTFKELEYPFAAIREVEESFNDRVESWACQSVLLASSYVIPMFIHSPALAGLEELAVWKLTIPGSLAEDQILRHMRIAGYGMLDFYETLANRGYNAVVETAVDRERRKRRDAAGRDGRDRFWRLLEDEENDTDPHSAQGNWVGGYFDILPSVTDATAGILETHPETVVAFGLGGGFMIDHNA